MMNSPFLQHITEQMRVKRYAKRTIETYIYWIKAFINFNNKIHPTQCHDREIEAFLSYLTNNMNVAPRTQALALNALVFLYRHIINKPLTLELNFNKSKTTTNLPVVLNKQEVALLLSHVNSTYELPCKLMYGSGLRLMEVVRLRVQDIDFDYHSICVWHGKGGKNRRVTLAKELTSTLKRQIEFATAYYEKDKHNSKYCGVWLPYALARKYPQAPYELGWQYLFPSIHLSTDPESNKKRRHHI